MTDHPPDPRALARLIADRLAERRETPSDVERRTGLHRATVHALMKRELKQTPRPDTLEKLATGLELPLSVVQDAAARSAGYFLTDLSAELEGADADPSLRLLVATARQLDAEDRRRLARMAEAYLADVKRDEPGEADGGLV